MSGQPQQRRIKIKLFLRNRTRQNLCFKCRTLFCFCETDFNPSDFSIFHRAGTFSYSAVAADFFQFELSDFVGLFYFFSSYRGSLFFFQFELRLAGRLLDCQSWLALAKQAAAVAVHHRHTVQQNTASSNAIKIDCFALLPVFFIINAALHYVMHWDQLLQCSGRKGYWCIWKRILTQCGQVSSICSF